MGKKHLYAQKAWASCCGVWLFLFFPSFPALGLGAGWELLKTSLSLSLPHTCLFSLSTSLIYFLCLSYACLHASAIHVLCIPPPYPTLLSLSLSLPSSFLTYSHTTTIPTYHACLPACHHTMPLLCLPASLLLPGR